ncbi:MAG: MBL fold metallo-hydrolase, partial [Promethearchaeota archaeon]
MSRDFKIPKEVLGRLIDLFNLDTEQKNQIFQEFKKFKPQTSARKYIKEVSKRTEISGDNLRFFFWISSDIYAISLENAKSFKEYFNNDIKSPLENDYPDLKKKIDNISGFENFLSRMANLIDFEYYKVLSLEGVNQINIGFSNIISLYLFIINDSTVLIDAGYSFKYWKNAFYKALNELQINIEDIDYCIITHEHPDHVGLVSDLKRANPEVKIGMHETAYELAKLREELVKETNIEEKIKERAELLVSYGLKKEEVDLMMQRFGRGGMGFEY